MEAKIVKKIEVEIRDVRDNTPYYHEAVLPPMQVMREGAASSMPITATQVTYERMSLYNPETHERTNWFVRVDDRKLWNELVKVSDGFINSKIEEGIQRFRDEFLRYEIPQIEKAYWNKGVKDAGERFLALSWWQRIFYKPKKLTTPSHD